MLENKIGTEPRITRGDMRERDFEFHSTAANLQEAGRRFPGAVRGAPPGGTPTSRKGRGTRVAGEARAAPARASRPAGADPSPARSHPRPPLPGARPPARSRQSGRTSLTSRRYYKIQLLLSGSPMSLSVKSKVANLKLLRSAVVFSKIKNKLNNLRMEGPL